MFVPCVFISPFTRRYQGSHPCSHCHRISCRGPFVPSCLAFGMQLSGSTRAYFGAEYRLFRPSYSRNQKRNTLVSAVLLVRDQPLPWRIFFKILSPALQSVLDFIKLASFFYGFVSYISSFSKLRLLTILFPDSVLLRVYRRHYHRCRVRSQVCCAAFPSTPKSTTCCTLLPATKCRASNVIGGYP